jgi:hypothetical protein
VYSKRVFQAKQESATVSKCIKVVRVEVEYIAPDVVVWVESVGARDGWYMRRRCPYVLGRGISQASVERALLEEIHMLEVQP